MHETDFALRWHAIQVKPNHEDSVSTLLRYKGYDEYVPSYRIPVKGGAKRAASRKLFPGYVFCRFTPGATGRVASGAGIVSTPGVLRVLGGRPPAPVEDGEIEAIQRVLAFNLKSEPFPYLPHPLRVGQKVEIERGPLRGIGGVILSSERVNRLVLSIELLQRSVAVTVEPEWVGMDALMVAAFEDARRTESAAKLPLASPPRHRPANLLDAPGCC